MSQQDAVRTLGELKQQVRAFVEARGWGTGHSPKNLAMSIAIEAAELMEHFQWRDNEWYLEPGHLTDEERHKIAMEAADVMIYLLSFCNSMGIDLAGSVQDKLERNEKRFPAVHVQNPQTS